MILSNGPRKRSRSHSSGRMAALDGLRAVSIGLVLLGHVSGTQGFSDFRLSRFLGDYANLGVIVFFVISGYLITTLLLEENERCGDISLRLFYARRFLRLMPALILFIAAVTVLQSVQAIHLNPGDLASALTYTVNFRSQPSHYIGHLWSLSVEEQFYFLWPAVLVMIGARKASIAAGGMLFLSPLSRLLALLYHWPGAIFPSVADSLACGCLLAIWGSTLQKKRWYTNLLAHRVFLPGAVATIFFCNAIRVYLLGITLGVSAINVLCALIIHRCILFKTKSRAFLSTRPLVLVGELSYSLYLWQQLFLDRHSGWFVCRFPENLLMAVLCASASYGFIERPLNALRRKLHPAALPVLETEIQSRKVCL